MGGWVCVECCMHAGACNWGLSKNGLLDCTMLYCTIFSCTMLDYIILCYNMLRSVKVPALFGECAVP